MKPNLSHVASVAVMRMYSNWDSSRIAVGSRIGWRFRGKRTFGALRLTGVRVDEFGTAYVLCLVYSLTAQK